MTLTMAQLLDRRGVQVGYHFGELSQQKLKAAGANLTFKSYKGLGHSLAPQEILDVKAFLKSCLPKV
jgi:predicted esterase